MASKEMLAPTVLLDPWVCVEHRVNVVVLVFVVLLAPLVQQARLACVAKLVIREAQERSAKKVSEATPALKAFREMLDLSDLVVHQV